jgi:transcriptional antiterminator RfaH
VARYEELNVDWYLVITKSSKERWVHDQLAAILPEVFLPMREARIPRWGRMEWTITPLFPGYLFARFDLEQRYFDVKYTPGGQGIVSAGHDPLAVPVEVIDQIRRRGMNGVVKLEEAAFGRGERLRVIEGPFRGFEAVFERYLSGAERVAILLSAIEASSLRVVLPASAVAR